MSSDIYHNYDSVLSHLPEAFPRPSIEAERIAQSLVQLFSRVGVARVILSDQGSNYTRTLLKQLYEMLGVKGTITVKIYLFPFLVRLNGLTISIAILLNSSLMIGVFTIGTLTLSLFYVL
jgi:hypothetical protein